MKFHPFIAGTTLTIATIVSAHSPAFSQEFKTPTHARLSELTTVQAPLQVAQPPAMVSQGTPQTPQGLNYEQTYFSASPRLVRSATSQHSAYVPSTYEFTLVVPANAGQSLKAVTIAQAENLETIRFDTNRSKAFAGDRYAAGSEISLASVGGDQPQNSKTVTIVFAQPVRPGSTVTVALEAKANPAFGGVYDFGVTAFPEGENGLGLFLGFGRFSFHSNQG